MQLGVMHANAARGTHGVELFAQQAVGPHTAGHHQALHARLLHGFDGFFDQHLNNRRLRAGRQIGLVRGQVGPQFIRLGEHCRFQAGKGKVQITAVQQGPGQFKRLRVAAFGQLGQLRPARVRQAQQLGRFVKGLASGIVNRLAQNRVLAHAIDAHQLGMPPRNQQRHKRKLRRIRT